MQSGTDVLSSVSNSQVGSGSHFVCTHNLRCWLVPTVQVYAAAVRLYTAICPGLTLNITEYSPGVWTSLTDVRFAE